MSRIVQRGQVFALTVPSKHTEGQEQFGHPWRPYVVMSRATLNNTGMAIVVPISKSGPKGGPFLDYVVPFQAENVFGKGAQLLPGFLLAHHVRSVDLQKRMYAPPDHNHKALLGTLDGATMKLVEAALLRAMEMNEVSPPM